VISVRKYYRKYHVVPKYLASLIKREHANRGFVGIIIYGKQGSGKSTLALWIAYYVLGSWDRVFDHLFFDPRELWNYASQHTGEPLPVLIADDAGVWFGKYLSKTNVKLADFVSRFIQLVRFTSSSLIVTVPHPAFLAKSLRDQPDWYYVYLRRLERKKQTFPPFAALRLYSTTPRIWDLVPKRLSEELPFPIYLPDDVYKRYIQVRATFNARGLAEFYKMFEQQGEEQQ